MRIFNIPDTQLKKGVPMNHLTAAGNYVIDKKPEIIVNLGDNWDLPSLSSYEKKGSKYFEGLRYRDDIEAGIEGMETFFKPINEYNAMRIRNKKRPYKPRLVFLMGNHEHRLQRAINEDPRLEGTIGQKDFQLEKFGWEVHQFLHVVSIEDILYSHFFVNPDSAMGTTLSGTIENKLRLVGKSFTQGHNQKRQYGIRYNGMGEEMHGMVIGAYYQHDEEYAGPQANRHHWRGCVMKNEVKGGRYDPCFLSMDYMLRRWL